MRSITGKLGNMRKSVEWTVYPSKNDGTEIIQSENRIAQIHLASGKALLSDGKGGHQGFMKLSKYLGATVVDCPDEIISQIKQVIGHDKGDGTIILGG